MRHQLRSRLAWTGLGSLGAGVWITPHVEREEELSAAIAAEPAAEARSFIAEQGGSATSSDLVADAWDLRPRPRPVRRLRRRLLARCGRRAAEACFRQQTLLVHAWRKFPFLDPDLPEAMLPAGWPRERAHALFVSVTSGGVRARPSTSSAGGRAREQRRAGGVAADRLPDERREMNQRLNASDIVDRQVAAGRGDAAAVIAPDATLTYDGLRRQVNRAGRCAAGARGAARTAGSAGARRQHRVPDRVPGGDADRGGAGAGQRARQGRQLPPLRRRLLRRGGGMRRRRARSGARSAGGRPVRWLVRGGTARG